MIKKRGALSYSCVVLVYEELLAEDRSYACLTGLKILAAQLLQIKGVNLIMNPV